MRESLEKKNVMGDEFEILLSAIGTDLYMLLIKNPLMVRMEKMWTDF